MKNLESSYREIAESGDVNTEDTIQTYLPDSTDEDTIMSVKDIVKKMTTKLLPCTLMYRRTISRKRIFIKDGVIVTNYHVIEGRKKVQKFSFPTEITWMWKEFYTRILMLILCIEIGK